jgi:hypothetical protein
VCSCSPSAHCGRYSFLPSIGPGEVRVWILLGGPHQTLVMVKINTIHSVLLQSKCTLWEVFFFTIHRARRGPPLDSIRRTSPYTSDGQIKYHPQCALAVQVHTVGGILFLPSIGPGEVLLCILLRGPHQTIVMVKINTIHSVLLQSKCTLWKVFFFTIHRARRGPRLYSIRRTSPDTSDGQNKYHPQCALAVQVHTVEGILFYHPSGKERSSFVFY